MKHCIIIGAGPGLGEAVARKFGGNGYVVSLIARRPSALRDQIARLKSLGIEAQWAVADAGDSAQLTHALDQLQAKSGPCDVLIYNAAVLRSEGVLDLDVDTLRAEFDVNLVGALVAAQTVAPHMIARGSGAIIFTGGGLALEPYPEWTSLALGKAALRSLAFSLYKELAPSGVHVSVIAVCGIVEPGGPFDPDAVIGEYFRLATRSGGVEDREVIIQPPGTDPHYNDSERKHAATSMTPTHARPQT